MRELRRSRNAQPVVVRENLGWEEVARVEFNAPDLPGVFIDLGQTRDYPEGELMSHIIGYTGRVADEDLNGRDDPVLALATMRFGKKGVERSLEDDLRGRAGAVQVEVNAVGRVVRELDRSEGQPGSNALLTIDLDLQRFAAEKLAEHQSGSVVVMDVVTGDIIAMVSTPGFDPNTFARGITQSEWREMLDSPERPLNNKSIGGVYPPGSTYKMVTALAALESRAIEPWTALPCNGFIELGDTKFHCWLRGGHGGLTVQGAIAASCDCFFYEAARRAGVDRIGEVAAKLGFGKLSELGLPGESPGNQPSRGWKQEKYGKPWQQGDSFNLGIGQGYMTATPMQLAVMTARIANGGYEVQPNLLLAKATPREELVPPPTHDKPTAPSLRFNPQFINLVRQGMTDVVNSRQRHRQRAAQRFQGQAARAGAAVCRQDRHRPGQAHHRARARHGHHPGATALAPAPPRAVRLLRAGRHAALCLCRHRRARPGGRHDGGTDRPRRAGRNHQARSVAPCRPLQEDGVAMSRSASSVYSISATSISSPRCARWNRRYVLARPPSAWDCHEPGIARPRRSRAGGLR